MFSLKQAMVPCIFHLGKMFIGRLAIGRARRNWPVPSLLFSAVHNRAVGNPPHGRVEYANVAQRLIEPIASSNELGVRRVPLVASPGGLGRIR